MSKEKGSILKPSDLEGLEKDCVLEIEGLEVEYVTDEMTIKAINGIDLSLNRGRTIGIVGETGAGKTTTLLSLLRLVPSPPGVIKAGKIVVNGKNIMTMKEKELERMRGNEIAMIFQDPMTSLNPVLTVGDQIAETILEHDKVTRSESWKRALAMLETVGIPGDRAGEYPHQFSGGMKQRVVIAIALACRPNILLADEPTTALDVTIQAQVLDLMKSLRDKFETSMILVTHDLGVVAESCDEVAVMYAGRIVEQGTLEDVFERASHPYTIGLFKSLPNINDRTADLIPIRGSMPDPSNLPPGCAFSPRCPKAMDICSNAQPETIKISETHSVACAACCAGEQ